MLLDKNICMLQVCFKYFGYYWKFFGFAPEAFFITSLLLKAFFYPLTKRGNGSNLSPL